MRKSRRQSGYKSQRRRRLARRKTRKARKARRSQGGGGLLSFLSNRTEFVDKFDGYPEVHSIPVQNLNEYKIGQPYPLEGGYCYLKRRRGGFYQIKGLVAAKIPAYRGANKGTIDIRYKILDRIINPVSGRYYPLCGETEEDMERIPMSPDITNILKNSRTYQARTPMSAPGNESPIV